MRSQSVLLALCGALPVAALQVKKLSITRSGQLVLRRSTVEESSTTVAEAPAADDAAPAALEASAVAAEEAAPAVVEAPKPKELPKRQVAKAGSEWHQLALPWMDRPSTLTGQLAGDAGFDPCGLVGSNTDLYAYREAEIKHARLAMLAAAGWPLAEKWDDGLANLLGWPSIIEENAGRNPSVLNGGLGLVSPVYWVGVLAFAAGIEAFSEFKKARAKADDSAWMVTGSFVPGDIGFDPLGLYTTFGTSDSAKMVMETAEIKNGRLAMCAVVAYLVQEFVSGKPVTETTPYFFEPIWQIVQDLMFNAPPLYSQ